MRAMFVSLLERVVWFVCLLKFLGWLVGSLKRKATLRNADCEVCREMEKKLSVIAKWVQPCPCKETMT